MTIMTGVETGVRRTVPNPEWVQMYRQGLPTAKVAELAGVRARTVRHHLHIAAQAEPLLREEHQAAAKPVKRIPLSGLRNMNETIALYKAEGRFPSTHAA